MAQSLVLLSDCEKSGNSLSRHGKCGFPTFICNLKSNYPLKLKGWEYTLKGNREQGTEMLAVYKGDCIMARRGEIEVGA